MISKQEAAIFALRVYEQGIRLDENFPFEPTGWIKIEPNPLPVTDGFAYGVFKNGNQIVISYRGTDGIGGMMGWDGINNLGLALGNSTSQAIQAAKVYAEVLRVYGSDSAGSNITFTGHSLGGGLAGMMAVLFARPAIVFDPAPFKPTVFNFDTVSSIIDELGARPPQALLDYRENIVSSYAAREAAVASHYAVGEFIDVLLRAKFNTIYATNTPYTFGNQLGEVSTFAMHSQALLAAGILSDSFRQSTVNLQRSLPIIMSKDFYSKEPDGSTERNFLLDLIRSEQTTPGNSKLSHIAIDFNYLGTNLAGLNKSAQDGIIAQDIEWYYWNQAFADAGKKQFFKLDAPNGLLQYTTAKGELAGGLASAFTGAQSRSNTYVNTWLTDFFAREQRLNHTDSPQSLNPDDYAQWNIATGVVLDGQAVDDSQRQIFIGSQGIDKFTGSSQDDALWGGNGDDELYGGGGNDKLFGGVGDDTLTGGEGNDRLEGGKGKDTLQGGAGLDTYIVGNGVDTVKDDAQGQGTVVSEAGLAYSGGRQADGGGWKSSDGRVIYVRSGDRLSIVQDGDAANRSVIEAFDFEMAKTGTYLGIHLADKPQDPPGGPPPGPPISPQVNTHTQGGIGWYWHGDPLVLDLNNNGISLTASDHAVLFDHNADGLKTGSQWAKADDGFLVRDLNGNGTIDSGRELFGDQTQVTSTNAQGQSVTTLAANGFAALSALDKDANGNADGIFNSSDVAYAELKVWRDLNQDGVSQSNEMLALADAGVVAINLAQTPAQVSQGKSSFTKTVANVDANGNAVTTTTTQTVQNVNLTNFKTASSAKNRQNLTDAIFAAWANQLQAARANSTASRLCRSIKGSRSTVARRPCRATTRPLTMV